jgi:hypothetical protein
MSLGDASLRAIGCLSILLVSYASHSRASALVAVGRARAYAPRVRKCLWLAKLGFEDNLFDIRALTHKVLSLEMVDEKSV